MIFVKNHYVLRLTFYNKVDAKPIICHNGSKIIKSKGMPMKDHRPAQMLFIFIMLALLALIGLFSAGFAPGSTRAATPPPDIPAIVDKLYLGVPAGNGYQPQRLTFDSQRQRLYTFNNGLAELDEGLTLSRFDQPTGQIAVLIRLADTRLPAQPTDLFPSNSFAPRPLAVQADPYRPRLYALWGDLYGNPPYSNLSILDTDTLAALTTLPDVRGVAAAPDRLYLVNETRLRAVYPDTLAQLAEITLPASTAQPPSSYLQPILAVNPTTNRLYLAQSANTLLALDATTLAVVGRYTAPAQLMQFTVDPLTGRVLVIDHDGAQVYLRALNSEAQPLTDPAPFILTDDTYSDPRLTLSGPTIYVTNRTIDAHQLQSFDAGLNQTGSRLIPGYPTDLTADPTTGQIYLAYAGSASYLLSLDPTTDARQPIYTALSLLDALADPANNRLYALTNDGGLHVLNLSDYTEIIRLETSAFNPQQPTYSSAPYLSFDAGRHRLYIGGDSPQVFDTATLTRLAALDTPGQLTADPASDRLFLTPPCSCRMNLCNTLILNADTFTGTATLFPPQEPLVAPCPMSNFVDVANRLLYTRINNGVPGSNGGAYFTVFNIAGPPQEIYTNGNISYSAPALDSPRARAFFSRYRMDNSFLERFELQGQTLTPTLQLAEAAGQLLFDPLVQRLYAVDNQTLQTFEADLTLLSQISLPGYFHPFTFDSPAQRLFLGNDNADLLIVTASGGQLEPPPPAKTSEFPDRPQLFVASNDVRFGIFNQQLYRSTDAGQSWQLLGQGLPDQRVNTLAISPNYPADRTLLAGLAGGLYRSTDGGDTWTPATRGLTDLYITGLAFSPTFTRDQTLFAASATGGLHRSTDGGSTWTALSQTYTDSSSSNAGLSSLAVSPTFAQNGLVIISHDTLLRSTTGGDAWQDTGLPKGLVAFAPVGLLSSEGRWRSEDGGQSWQPSAAGLAPNQGARSLFFSPTFAADQTVYLLLDQNYEPPFLLQRSTAAGRTWQLLLNGLPPDFQLAAATVLPNGNLYLSDSGGQLLEMSPQSLTWGRPPVDPTALELQAMAVAPNQTLFVANSEAGVLKSEDGGRTWADTDFPGRANDTNLAQLALSADGTLVGAMGTILERSDDGGQNWAYLPLPAGFTVNALAVSPNLAADGVILTGGNYAANQILRSNDGGQSWQVVFEGQTVEGAAEIGGLAVSPNFAGDGAAYAWLQYGGLLRSTDGGQNWARVPGPYDSATAQVLAVSPDGKLYLGALYGGLYVSADGGQSWQDLSGNISDQRVWSSALAFGPNNLLLLGTDIGLYRSADGGQSWSAASAGLPLDASRNTPQAVRTLAFDGQRFYAALIQGGVYVSDDLGQSWRKP